MSWFGFWIFITLMAWLGLLIISAFNKNPVPLSEKVASSIGFLFILAVCFGVLVLFLSQVIAPIIEGIGNWWGSQSDATSSTSGDNKVPPYFFLIPMFMMLGFIIRGGGN